jgi:hypothetical protein
MFGWELTCRARQGRLDLDGFFAAAREHDDYLHVFVYRGRRVTRQDLDWDQWMNWQAESRTKPSLFQALKISLRHQPYPREKTPCCCR